MSDTATDTEEPDVADVPDQTQTPDADDTDAIVRLNAPTADANQVPSGQAVSQPVATWSDFVKQQDSNQPQTWDDFTKQQDSTERLRTMADLLPLGPLANIATGDEMTPGQRLVTAWGPIGHIVKAFGQQAGEYEIESEADSSLFKSELASEDFKNYQTGTINLENGWHDGLVVPAAQKMAATLNVLAAHIMTPAVAAGEFAWNAPGAAIAGVLGYSGALDTLGEETNTSRLTNELGEMAEVSPALDVAIPEIEQGIPHISVAQDMVMNKFVREPTTTATIGPGATDDTYFGTEAPGPELSEAMNNAAAALPAPDIVDNEPAEVTAPAAESSPTTPSEPDIHAVARQIDPDTFAQYDPLVARNEVYGRWLRELSDTRQEQAEANAPHNDEISALQDKLADANPRMTKIYQAKIDDLTDKNQAWISDAVKQDTPDIAKVRAEYLKNLSTIQDIANSGKIKAAYDEASKQVAARSPESTQAESSTATATATATEPETLTTEPQGGTESAGIPDVTAAKQAITNDVSKKLTAAGRSQDEADAAAQIVAEHYAARSARFKGALGAPDELYNNEGPAITTGNASTKNAAIRLGSQAQDARSTIRLMQNANASSFIHEMGHDWLDELVRDSQHELAPDDLKADAETVKSWLGAKEGPYSGFTRSQHEKFARGVERYFMEGVAPSKNLVRIFDQFKTWMTQIYQTVSKLRSPINDDIRAVFDRMLSENPERQPVVAPEEPAGKALADIHTQEVQTTPPARAAEAADTIEHEINLTAHQHAPEIENAIKSAESADETAQVAGPATGNPEPGSPTGANTGESSAPEQPGAFSDGGGATAPESVGSTGAAHVGEPGTGSDDGSDGGSDSTTSPAEQRAERDAPNTVRQSQSKLRDKAGNIRTELFTDNRSVKDFMLQEAQLHPDVFNHDVVPDAEIDSLAQNMGKVMTNSALRELKSLYRKDGIPLAVRVRVGDEMLSDAAQKGRDAMAALRRDNTLENRVTFAEARRRHLMIAEAVSGSKNEWGLAGRAMRANKMKNMESSQVTELFQKMTGLTEEQIVKMAQTDGVDTAGKMAKYNQDSTKRKFGDMIVEYRTNMLISGPITHARYLIGNLIQAVVEPVFQTPIAAAIGATREALGHDVGDRVYLGESKAQIFAMVKGSTDGLGAAVQAWHDERSPDLAGESVSDQFMLNRAIPNPTIKGVTIPLGTAVRIPGRAVTAIHAFSTQLRYEQNNQGMAYRTAMNEGRRGLDRDTRIAELTQEPTLEMMEWARSEDPASALAIDRASREGLVMGTDAFHERVSFLQYHPTDDMITDIKRINNMVESAKLARKQLYMAPVDYDSHLGQLQGVINRWPAAKCIIPFMKIGTQVETQAMIEGTPLALINRNMRNDIFYKNSGARGDMANAKIASGVALMSAAVGMTLSDLMTGDGPEDPAARAGWLLTHTANTIQIGDIRIPYKGLGYLGMQLRFAANMAESYKYWDGDKGFKAAGAFMEGFTKSVLDDNWMYGLKSFLDAVYHHQQYGKQFISDFATSWTPYSIGLAQTAREFDPYRRSKSSDLWEGMWDTERANLPWASEGLEPKVDIFGQPIAQGALGSTLAGIPKNPYGNDPVAMKLNNLGIGIGTLQKKIRGIDLNEQQYNEFATLAGRKTKAHLDNLVAQPSFSSLPVGRQIESIHNVVTKSRNDARNVMMLNYPAIAQQAHLNKLKIVQ